MQIAYPIWFSNQSSTRPCTSFSLVVYSTPSGNGLGAKLKCTSLHESVYFDPISRPIQWIQSPPCIIYFEYPSFFISLSNKRAVSCNVQPALGGQSEKQKPGKLGTTTWNAGSLGLVGWDSGPQTELNSQKVPGQPWHMMRGIASLRSERAWTKCSLTSSTRVV